MAPVGDSPVQGVSSSDSPGRGPSGLETWSSVKPIGPRGCLDGSWARQFPLCTKGRHIIDNLGERFRLRGVNWYGASDVLHVVGGLDTQSLEVICQSVYDLGFNVVRLPFSNEMLRQGLPPEGSIDFAKNPRLRGLTALEVYDEVVRSLGRCHVAVIINNHTTFGEFCGPPSRNSLWFDPYGSFTEEQWLQDWSMMARRYLRCPHVVGYDLRNEIRPRKSHWPTWRSSGDSLESLWGRCNWARAARLAAKTLSAINPSALIVVERIVWPQRGLDEMAELPGPLLPALQGRLVLGAHMYSWSGPGRFVPHWSEPQNTGCFFGLLRAMGVIAKKNYGDLGPKELREQVFTELAGPLKEERCPVWVSEFGADASNAEEMQWLSTFVGVLDELDADWAYWPLNVGNKPGVDADEAYGMLSPSWRPKANGDVRLALLKTIGLQPPADATSFSETDGVAPPVRTLGALRRSASKASSRSLLGSKDPLLGILSTPDVKGALSCLAPTRRRPTPMAEALPEGGRTMRRAHSAQPTLTEELLVGARTVRDRSEKRVLSWSSFYVRTFSGGVEEVGPRL